MIALGIDFETTGLNPEADEIIEIGWCFWDCHENKMISMGSVLTAHENEIPSEISNLTGIKEILFPPNASNPATCLNKIICSKKIEYLVSHNADFEKSFIFNKNNESPVISMIPWIDTRFDIPYKRMKGNGTLSEICMNHGIFNPMPHRAGLDALAMMQLLSLYPIESVLARAKSPVIEIKALVSFEQKELAKKEGYHWDGEKRIWIKKIKQLDLDAEQLIANKGGFEIEIFF